MPIARRAARAPTPITIAPETTSTALPQPELAQRDDQLRVLRLRQREVELAVTHLVHRAAPCSAGSPRGSTPPSRICTPRITSSSDCVQPFSVVVCEYTSASTTRPTPTESGRLEDATKKFARYCISFSDAEAEVRASRGGARASVAHRRVVPHREPPDARRRASAPIAVHSSCMPRPPSSCAVDMFADERLDREVERPLERQPRREGLRPVRHQRQRQSRPESRSSARNHTSKIAPRARRPDRHHPERRSGSASGSGRRPRSRRGRRRPRAASDPASDGRRARARRDRQVQHDHGDLLAREPARGRSGSGAAAAAAAPTAALRGSAPPSRTA